MGKSKRSKRNRRKSKHNIKVDISQLTKEESNDRQEGGKLNEHKSSGSNIDDEETCSGDNSLCSNLTSETNDLDNVEDLIDEELLPVDPEEFKEYSVGDKLEDCVGCDNKEDKMYGALLLSDPTCSVLKYNEFIEDKICQILGDDDGLNETCDEINKVEMLWVSENDMNIEEMLDDSIHSVLHEKVIMNDVNSREIENDTFTDLHTLENEDESENSNMLKKLNNLHSDNYHIVKPELTNENDVVVSEASEDIFESFDNSLDIESDESIAPKKDNEVQIKLDIENKINNQNNVINIICDSSKEKLCILNELSPSKSSLRNNFSASENSLSDIFYDADQSNDVDTNNKPLPFIKIVDSNQLSISSAIFDKHIGQISDCNQNVVCDEELDKPLEKYDVDKNVNDNIDIDSLESKSDEININVVFDTEMAINEHEVVNKQSTTDKIKQGIITPLLKRRSKKSKNKNKQVDEKDSSENVASNLKKGSFLFNSFKKRKSSKTDMPDAMEKNLERSSSRSSLYKLTEDEVVDSNTEEKNSTYDIMFTHNSKNVIHSEKSSSVSDLSSVGEKKPIRKLSFIRQLLNSKTYSVNDLPSVGEDKLTKKPSFLERSKRMLTSELFKNQSTNLRRSTSCRDVTDCSIKTRTRLSDTKRMDWSSSLQSLQEDRVVSAVSSHTNLVPEHDSVEEEHEIELSKTRSDDFSVPALKRTQSCSSSSVGRRCGVLHSSAVARNYSSNLDLSAPLDTPLPSYKYIGQDDESHRIPQIQRGSEAETNEKSCSTNNTDQGGNYVNALRFKTTSVDESWWYQSCVTFTIAGEALESGGTAPTRGPSGELGEWRRFVGSIRRRVQRHATVTLQCPQPVRKGSLTPESSANSSQAISKKSESTNNLRVYDGGVDNFGFDPEIQDDEEGIQFVCPNQSTVTAKSVNVLKPKPINIPIKNKSLNKNLSKIPTFTSLGSSSWSTETEPSKTPVKQAKSIDTSKVTKIFVSEPVKVPVKQTKSIEVSTSKKKSNETRSDFFKSFKDKTKNGSTGDSNLSMSSSPKNDFFKSFKFKESTVKNDTSSASKKSEAVAKLSKMKFKDTVKNVGVSESGVKDGKNTISRDDFLKATMRIFLVVSPPMGKMQVRSRSLTHLDNLDPSLLRSGSEMDSGGGGVSVTAASTPCGGSDVGAVGDHPVPSPGVGSAVTLKDALSEPDCSTRFFRPSQPLLMVPPPTPLRTSPSANSTAAMKRFMMSQSQVSSSEYFSVYFDIDTDDSYPIFGREEYLPGCKGVSLFDALGAACERRGVELGACDIYLDGERLPPQMMAAETTELGRRQLRLIPKDLNKPPRLKATSSLNYKTKGGRFFSHSTEDTTLTPNANIVPSFDNRLSNLQDGEKKGKQRWSGFFSNNKDVKMESLVDHLNNYSRHGIPCFDKNSTTSLNTEAPYDVEDDWRCLMDGINFTEKQQQQQTALWELITTEVAYIRMLKVVKDLFLACLQSLQSSNILTEISTTKLFSNIMEIHATNAFFWREHIYPMLHQVRVSHTPLKPEFLEQGFARFRDIFEPYTKYCSDQAKCQMYCREMHSQNNYFKAYLAWCETQKECNRLQLMDILVRPMQRLTKYGLLLKVIYKNSDLEEQKDSLTTMIRSVDEFVNSVNSTLKYKQDSESLCRMMSRIESYDLVDSKDDDLERIVQKYNELDLSMPMLGCSIDRRRHLLAEDDFKLRDSTTSKMEVHSVLLTDLLLICKTSTKKGANGIRVIRQPYIVDRLVVETSRDNLHCVYLNEFKMAVAAFSLQGDSKKVKNWYEHIRKAQTLYRQAKQASAPVVRQQSVNEPDPVDMGLELTTTSEAGDGHSLLGLSLIQRSPLATSSRASRVSSLAHSHSGSVEMNESSVGSVNNQSRAVSVETDQRTASISSDEGVQSLPNENMQKSPMATKSSLKHRLLNQKVSTPNTLSVQPYGNLGQSLPNLTLGSPNTGTIGFVSPSQNTLSVPSSKNTQNLLSPNNRGISYPPPSPTRANLRRGFAIMQPSNKNPPLLKTRHITSTANTIHSGPTSIDIDVPLIAGISPPDEALSTTNDGQAIYKKINRTDNRKHHTAGIVDDLKKDNVHGQETIKRLSWNYSRDQTKEDQCST